ncbi:MAG: dTDP-4-dehydrorhamnose 3,5-epimerase [Ignavibacteria bacterium]|nr:dTDP-4-dehydrorhamnose 3,5-epimerase [Ignavibacteria bacterium]
MKVLKTSFRDLLVIIPDVFPDARGYFFESYNSEKFINAGLDLKFVQDNISKSIYGTVRGLHYQTGEYAQGKLCQVINGKVLDVAVDIRSNSPTFGKYFSVELTEENHKQLFIPPGFAHGFSVLSEIAVFHYKCTALYSRKDERAIRYNDEDLNIDWKIKKPLVSEKDVQGKSFREIEKDFFY